MDVELAPVACLAFVRHSTTDKAQSDCEDADRARALTEVEYMHVAHGMAMLIVFSAARRSPCR